MAAMSEMVAMDVSEEARHVLSTSPYPDVRELSVSLDGGTLIVFGNVRSYYLKQLAQEKLRAVALEYGRRIVNNVDVIDVLS